jgi:hypothetical protein
MDNAKKSAANTKRAVCINVDVQNYTQFKQITKRIGTNASAVINEYIYRYVKEHQDLLQ